MTTHLGELFLGPRALALMLIAYKGMSKPQSGEIQDLLRTAFSFIHSSVVVVGQRRAEGRKDATYRWPCFSHSQRALSWIQ